jgi:hypothetical protein
MFQASSRRQLFTAIAILVIAAGFGVHANATPIVEITTFQGGADAEVRESDAATDFLGAVVGTNRGHDREIASRINDGVDPQTVGASSPTPTDVSDVSDGDGNWFRTGDRSSVIYTKFDLTNLPSHLQNPNDPFWTSYGDVTFRMHVRNGPGNFNNLFGTNPSDPNETVNLRIRYHGLEPGATYIEDGLNPASRTDRVGNAHSATQWRYNWNEGDNTAGSGITFYNAPGIQPHCTLQGSCFDNAIAQGIVDKINMEVDPDITVAQLMDPISSPYPATRDALNTSVVQTLGIYDDFDSNYVRDLGTVEAIDFLDPDVSMTGLPLGGAVDLSGASLKQLIRDALIAGRDYVTIMTHIDNDGTKNQPNTFRPGVTPDGMLNRNYVFVPKDCGDPTASASACNAMFANTYLTGDFAPTLLFIPEPSSALLAGLAMLGAGLIRRRA